MTALINDEEVVGGPLISAASPYGKELIKWEQHKTDLVIGKWTPGNPYVFREFPKSMYRAMKRPNGSVHVLEPLPNAWDVERADQMVAAITRVEAQNAQCHRTAKDADEEVKLYGQGWRKSIPDAMALYQHGQDEIADLAARVQFDGRRMGSKAQAELKAMDAATDEHVLDIAGGSKKTRRSRKPKAVTGSGVQAD